MKALGLLSCSLADLAVVDDMREGIDGWELRGTIGTGSCAGRGV